MNTEPDRTPVITQLRPRFEGANIQTWIGFKTLMSLAEESVRSWFRAREFGPQRLFQECGLACEVTDQSVLLPALLEVDDEVTAETARSAPDRFTVRLRVVNRRDHVVLTGKVGVALVGASGALDGVMPDSFRGFVRSEPSAPAERRRDVQARAVAASTALRRANPAVFYWTWRARYFECNYSNHLQHSAYIRALEEIVDRFLTSRGLSIGRVLSQRNWIPVVSRVRVQTLAPVQMDELVHTTFFVDDVLKDTAFDGQMDCYVRRGDLLVHVATARILHGYAIGAGPEAGRLTTLDHATVQALTKRRRE